MEQDGYRFSGWGFCSHPRCRRRIAWMVTPAGKRMPIDRESLQPHWSTCPAAKEFRGSEECRKRGFHVAHSSVSTRDPATGETQDWVVCRCGARRPRPSSQAEFRWQSA